MNRTELIDAVSADTGLTRSQSEAALDAVVYQVTAGVRAGSPVRITGFGTFKLRERPARTVRNPQTGEKLRAKASKGIGFTPGTKLRQDLNTRGALAKPKSIAAKKAAKAPARAARSTAGTGARAASPAAGRRTAGTTTARKSATAAKTPAPARKTAAKKAATRR